MRVETLFRSKVGRRMLAVFFLCALLPVCVLAVLSYSRVTEEVYGQSRERLFDQTKTAGLVLVERLMFVRSELVASAHRLSEGTDLASVERTEALVGIRALTHRLPGGSERTLLGDMRDPPRLSPAQEVFLEGGNTVMATQGSPPRVLLAHRVRADDPEQGTLWVQVDPDFLWQTAETYAGLTGQARLCVLDSAGEPIHCDGESVAAVVPRNTGAGDPASGLFEWNDGRDPYLAGYREIFLRGAFMAPAWTIVVSEPQADYIALLADFRSTFLLSVAAALTLVTLLGTVQIRRNLEPLQKLKVGAQQVTAADFEAQVSITSGDEFEELGDVFNQMTSQLGRQFRLLTSVTEIERAALSSVPQREIIETILTNLLGTFDSDVVALFMIEDKRLGSGKSYAMSQTRPCVTARFTLTPAEGAELELSPDHLRVAGKRPRYLDFGPLTEEDVDHLLLLPMFRDTRLAGVIVLGSRGKNERTSEDLDHARQIADHAALALANVTLISELDDLQIGSLTALARAVDAKSPWTSGHSERVTELSVAIAQAMGLDSEELSLLRRGGLLHDIGKIGVPASVLDKPGKLTPEEWAMMQEHPSIGARILEPLGAFQDIIPIVREHHERFDGTGYPDGKKGQEIDLLASVLAVADVFDAVTSDRPYRSGEEPEWALDVIQKSSGSHFDPDVVEAFVRVVAGSQERLRAFAFAGATSGV